MVGVQIAAYEGRSAMEEIYPYIIVMFSFVIFSLFAKAGQQIGMSTIGFNLASDMR